MTARPSQFGPQPIRAEVHRRGWTYADFIADTLIRPQSHVRHAMNGVCPPSEELRQRAAEMLGLPVTELFTADALAAIRQPGRPRGPKPKVGAS